MNYSNYMGLAIVAPLYLGLAGAFFFPPPYNAVVFWTGMFGTFLVLFVLPKAAKWISQGLKQMWAIADTDELEWTYGGRLQFWFLDDPAQASEWLDAGEFWQTFVHLCRPFVHPKYNAGRRIYGIYVRHDDTAFDHKGIELTQEQRKALSAWVKLFPKHGGFVSFMAMWVWNPNSDAVWFDEVMPSAEELKEAETAIETGEMLLNHVPIVKDGIAYPVFQVRRAQGSKSIEKDLAKMLALETKVHNGEYHTPKELIIEVEAK